MKVIAQLAFSALLVLSWSPASLYAQAAQAPAQRQQPEFIKQGQQLMREGKLEEALALYRQTLQSQPLSLPANVAAGNVLDLLGRGDQARKYFQKTIDIAEKPEQKASANRAMAMSYAFEGGCKRAVEYEQKVFDYYFGVQDFFQQGEIADEAARVCIDDGDLDTALRWYKLGHDSGLREPDIKRARVDLWNFRWEHAQARIAARRGNLAEAQDHVTAAKAILDKGAIPEQAQFFPYLQGYVALYGQDYKTAAEELLKANQNDPFIQCLLGQTYEKLGEKDKATECYRKAASATAHNPPAAYAVPFAKKRLASVNTIGRERVPLTGQVLARVEPLTGYGKNLLGGQLYDVFVFGVDNGQGQDSLVPVKIVYEFYPNDPSLPEKFFDYSTRYELSVRRDARCDQNLKNLSYETDVEPGKPPHPRNILNVLNGAAPDVLKPDLILPCFFLWPGQYKTLNDRRAPD